ncbi:MAG: sugar-specific transcriptional regulator TrmB [Candidatus Azotimanducaceae bacterium]|jgi:sugar-specific transcriptional regulator TrmB
MLAKTLDLLQQLGFTAYESKAYVALLEAQPSGAYDIAKRSGIPSSKIYETLNKLLRKSIIRFSESNVADNPHYVALPPDALVEQLNQQIRHRSDELLPLLGTLKSSQEPDFIWPIANIEKLIEKSTAIVQSAQKSILISCWAAELSWIKDDLEAAESRKIKIALVHFGQPETVIGATYHHPVEETLYTEKGGRGFTLVVDGEVVVIANLNEEAGLDASWSRNRTFVTVAEDYVKHDVYITKVTRFLNEPMIERFGANYQQLRNIFDSEA